MKVIMLTNQKGGVGKTTTAITLAYGLNRRGKRVLLVDLDPQSNSSFAVGVDLLNVPATLYDVFRGEADMEQAVQSVRLGLDVVTGGLGLTAADSVFTDVGRERLLCEALEPIQDKYDYAVIDSSPSLGILITAGMTAADYLIIPLTADALALQGLNQLSMFIKRIRKYCNPSLKVAGLLLTMYNPRIVLTRSLEQSIQQSAAAMNTKVFQTRIRRSQAVTDTIALRGDFFSEAPSATATEDYTAFISELLQDLETEG